MIPQGGPRWPQEAQGSSKRPPRWSPRWPKIAQDGSKMAQDRPMRTQVGAKITPRWELRARCLDINRSLMQENPQNKNTFKTFKKAAFVKTPGPPQWPQDGPKIAQDGSRYLQDGPKMGSRGAQDCPGWPQDGPRWSQDGLKMAQDGPRGPQEASKTAQEASRRHPKKNQEAKTNDDS